MIVKLWDNTEIVISKEQSDRLKKAIASKVTEVEIGNRWMKTSAIATIMPGGEPPQRNQLNRVNPQEHRGEPSPTAEKIKTYRSQGLSFKQTAEKLKTS